jgi:hypothetical protein
MKRILLLTTLALGILGGTTAQAQSGGVPLWTNIYNGPANEDDYANAVAVDSSGNVFVTGALTASSEAPSDFVTIKYSGAGVPVWTNRYHVGNAIEEGYDEGRALAVDGSGNVFVTGPSWSGGLFGSTDFATIKYSGAGVALWTNRYNGPGNYFDFANAMAVDASGNVFVAGYSARTNVAPYNYDYATIKYSGAGVVLWTNRYNGPGNSTDQARAVAVDGSGNVFVTGESYGSGGVNPDYATIKYSGAGVALWTNRYNGPGNSGDFAVALAVDGSSNVFVAGYATGTNGSFDYATIAYSGVGVALWTNRYNGPGNSTDQARAVAVDGSGNVFVTGQSVGGGSGNDYATIAYSGAGVGLWTNRYNGPGNSDDYANAMAVDDSGNVFVTGQSVGGDGSFDYATIAYSGAGVALWTNRYSGPGNDYDFANALAVDGSGNVFVTGGATGSNGYYDYATIKYSSAIPPSLTVARTTTNTVVISWPSPSTGFVLQQNDDALSSPGWSYVTDTIQNDGTNKTLVVNPSGGSRFYRLFKP